MRVLLATRDATVLELAERTLSAHNHQSLVANDLVEISRLVELAPTGMIVLDEASLGDALTQACREIRSSASGRDVALAVVMERDDPRVATAVLEAGAEYVMLKSDGAAALERQLLIAERHRAVERELARAKDKLKEANRELETFSYAIAHDLRAPLRSIDGFSEALLEDYAEKLDAQGKKYLGFVRASAQHMAELIDGVLALSRVGRGELAHESIDLGALARRTYERLQLAEPAREVEIVIEEGLTGLGDARLLTVVLDNLLANAWKFTAKRRDARIEVGETTPLEGPRTYFVRDNGVGFDMAYADKLFGLFQRLHTAEEFPGAGVGLAIVQRIIHRHGGRVWAEGQVGVGATFYFTLSESNV